MNDILMRERKRACVVAALVLQTIGLVGDERSGPLFEIISPGWKKVALLPCKIALCLES